MKTENEQKLSFLQTLTEFLFPPKPVESVPATMGSSPVIVEGPGIDPTGLTPSSDGLNRFFKLHKRGTLRIPQGFYWLDAPVKLYESGNYVGEGSTPYQPTGHRPGVTKPSGTLFFAKESESRPFRPDAEGHRTMFISETWTQNDKRWMHHFGFRDIGLDGDKVADYGMKIYQMGEVGHISDCCITNFRQAGILATGSHAPFTLRNCTINGPHVKEAEPNTNPKTWVNDHPYTGLHFAKHPTMKGSGGEIRIFGLSGDGNNGGILRVSGGHQVTIVGAKFENNGFATIVVDQQGLGGLVGRGGGAASINLIGGYSQDPTSHYKPSEEMIRITEGATPTVTIQGFVQTTGSKIDPVYGYQPAMIRNVTTGEEIPYDNVRSNMVTYGPSVSEFHANIQMGKLTRIAGTLPSGKVKSMLEINTDQITALRAVNSAGAAIKDARGTARVKVNSSGVGFNGASPSKPPTITGTSGSVEVMSQILTCLDDLGLIDDQTT